eukprot:g20384.t1
MYLWIGYAADGVLGMSRIRHASRPDDEAQSGIPETVRPTPSEVATRLKTKVSEVLKFIKLVADNKPGFLPPHLKAGLGELPPSGSTFGKPSKDKLKVPATLSMNQMGALDLLAGKINAL